VVFLFSSLLILQILKKIKKQKPEQNHKKLIGRDKPARACCVPSVPPAGGNTCWRRTLSPNGWDAITLGYFPGNITSRESRQNAVQSVLALSE
jgi:hypothetical protein